ncbi:MAG: transglycosylase domain-containing protein [Cryomorphaceae bacterium]|nr:transglycosylase domain-containing protein [Cryomorphaceae bacterium]
MNRLAPKNTGLPEETVKKMTYIFWGLAMFPFLLVTCLILFQSEDDLPPVEMLDNPPELQASIVLASDGKTELGRYWKVNRTSVSYKEISPFVTDALISTEDERFLEHSGVDFRALGRAVVNLGGAGGASPITQQLAKLLFTLQQREREELARAMGESISNGSSRIGRLFSRVGEKARENIIATRLEQRFSKEEIITMYLNQFDFLYNAVGIENAAKVYFNKKPSQLSKDEAAMLVGMCKNPTLYNPYTFKIRNYRTKIANEKGIKPEDVTREEILERRAADSLRAHERRNQVLFQWLKNSESENEALRNPITREEYDKLKDKPLAVNYQEVDHKQGSAPYFREAVRKELTTILMEKSTDGTWKYHRQDGSPYDIYRDGLKIYTTVDANLQSHAEAAVERHLKENLQSAFDDNNKRVRNFPFSNDLSNDEAESIMRTARLNSPRYAALSSAGMSDADIVANFNTPTPMRVFSWKGDKDTTMTPNDSIRYYKSFLHAGMISIEPQTGFVKAWVGGANFRHFAFDHVRQGKRQVGSTIKPFVYATAMAMGVVKPCTEFANTSYCVDLQDADGNIDGRWCPKNAGGSDAGVVSASTGLAQSMNNITVAVMARMGGYSGPKTISKMLAEMDIHLTPEQEVPSLCLGIMDLSLYELVGAQCIFANNGIYNRPTTILRVEDRNGNVIYSAKSYSKEVLDESVAYETLQMMKKVVTQGTAGSLRGGQSWGNVLAPTAGKTGTTQSNSDGWFVGLTPDLVTGVWVGAEDRGVRFRSMNWGQGARMALPMYGYYMQKVYKDPVVALSTLDFSRPESYDASQFSCSGGDYIAVPEEEEENPFGIE